MEKQTNTCTTHTRTHTHNNCSRNWVLILVGMKILWEEEGFQFDFKRWQDWAVSKVLPSSITKECQFILFNHQRTPHYRLQSPKSATLPSSITKECHICDITIFNHQRVLHQNLNHQTAQLYPPQSPNSATSPCNHLTVWLSPLISAIT